MTYYSELNIMVCYVMLRGYNEKHKTI